MAVVLGGLLVGCVGHLPSAASDCAHKIGYISSGGDINDGGVNEAGWNGVVAGAEALGLSESCTRFVAAADSADVLPHAEQFAAAGYDIVVTAGLALRDVTREAAFRNPQVTFIGVEQRQTGDGGPPEPIDNLAGLVFHEDAEGFLAGALAGLVTESNVVGGVFGCEIIPPTIRYRVGFRNGARLVNPAAEVLIATHPGTPDVCFFDPAYGAQLAEKLLAEGADVLFAEGYQTGEGAIMAACERGVDVIDSGFDPSGRMPDVQPCAMSSVSRDVEGGVRDLIVSVGTGDFQGGDVFGEVRLASYGDVRSRVGRDTNARMEALAGALAKGEIDPCAPPNEGAMCTPVRQ